MFKFDHLTNSNQAPNVLEYYWKITHDTYIF